MIEGFGLRAIFNSFLNYITPRRETAATESGTNFYEDSAEISSNYVQEITAPMVNRPDPYGGPRYEAQVYQKNSLPGFYREEDIIKAYTYYNEAMGQLRGLQNFDPDRPFVIVQNKADQLSYVFENGHLMRIYPISTGNPNGGFVVQHGSVFSLGATIGLDQLTNEQLNASGDPRRNLYGPYFYRLYPLNMYGSVDNIPYIALHGTDPDTQEKGIVSGNPVTPGCSFYTNDHIEDMRFHLGVNVDAEGRGIENSYVVFLDHGFQDPNLSQIAQN